MARRPGSLSKIRALARKLAKEEETQQEQRRSARALARKGRGGDTEIAHVTPGEIVIPKELQTPEVMAALSWAAAGAGLALDRLRVGARANSINPKTGAPEFRVDDTYKRWQDQPPTPIPEIVVRGGLGGSRTFSPFFGGSLGGAGGGSGPGAGRGEAATPMEEIVVTGTAPAAPPPYVPPHLTPFTGFQNTPQKGMKICKGRARVLEGNPRHIGRNGGFGKGPQKPYPVRPDSAVVDFMQWGPDKEFLRPFIEGISGTTRKGQSFNGISDIIGSKDVPNVRDVLKNRFPDALILEFVNGKDEGVTDITLQVPEGLACPFGTREE